MTVEQSVSVLRAAGPGVVVTDELPVDVASRLWDDVVLPVFRS